MIGIMHGIVNQHTGANKEGDILPRAKKSATEYYSYDDIDKLDAVYNLVIGQRSNGKTYGMLKKIIDAYINDKLPSAYIRREKEEIVKGNIGYIFDVLAGYIEELTDGTYNGVVYVSHAWYLCRYAQKDGEDKKVAQDRTPFCRAYAISTADKTKGADPGAMRYIVFDEFITRRFYLTNEFVLYQNLLSSIIRNRENTKIYMLGNTVNKYCPYFADMGLHDIGDMDQGTIDLYIIGRSKTKIAVEYCSEVKATKKVSKYFAFDNPQLTMITKGNWEIALYRHAPENLDDAEIVLSFFVVFANKTVQGDIYIYRDYPLIFWHPKTTPLQHPDSDIIYYADTYDGNPLHQVALSGGSTKAQRLIERLIRDQKTFYSDNTTGEFINNWLKSALMPKLIKG